MHAEAFANCLSVCQAIRQGAIAHVGDTIKVSATRSDGLVTQGTIADLTSGHKISLTAKAGGAPAAQYAALADAALHNGSSELRVANFGKITWTKGSITIGTAPQAIGSVPIGSTGREGYNLQTTTNVLQILTGAVSGSANNSFTTTWKHS